MRKIRNPFIGKEGYNCFGCSPDNPFGLHMEFYEDGDDVVSYWHPHDHFQGWTGVMHGGILATMIDETAGWVVMRKLQTSGMTSRLNLKYLYPVSSDSSFTGRCACKNHRTQAQLLCNIGFARRRDGQDLR